MAAPRLAVPLDLSLLDDTTYHLLCDTRSLVEAVGDGTRGPLASGFARLHALWTDFAGVLRMGAAMPTRTVFHDRIRAQLAAVNAQLLGRAIGHGASDSRWSTPPPPQAMLLMGEDRHAPALPARQAQHAHAGSRTSDGRRERLPGEIPVPLPHWLSLLQNAAIIISSINRDSEDSTAAPRKRYTDNRDDAPKEIPIKASEAVDFTAILIPDDDSEERNGDTYDEIDDTYDDTTRICRLCGNPFTTTDRRRRYCSWQCSAVSREIRW